MRRKISKELLVYTICAGMALTPIQAFAETEAKVVNVTVSDWSNFTNTDYLKDKEGSIIDIGNTTGTVGKIVIPNDISNLTIKGRMDKVYSGLVIEDSVGRTTPLILNIENLNILNGNINITKNSTLGACLKFTGESKIIGANQKAGISVNPNSELTIKGSTTDAKLEVIGGTGAAGIGGDYNTNGGSGDIIIESGIINATGTGGGAGIGQGVQPNGTPTTKIYIKGGTITADGGSTVTSTGGAGIGGSKLGSVKDIDIRGTSTVVTAKGGNGAAGIGAGSKQVDNIFIHDGAVIREAIGGTGGAGIGGGADGSAKVQYIEIIGGKFGNIIGGASGAGIGGGNQSTVGTSVPAGSPMATAICIDNAVFENILGGEGASGIGAGKREEVLGNIIIKGNTRISKVEGGGNPGGPDGGAAIGGGHERSSGLKIEKDVVIEKAKGGYKAPAFGGGENGASSNNNIVINGKVYAESGDGVVSNDIGGGYNRVGSMDVELGDEGDVFIRNNKVTVIDSDTLNERANYIFQCYEGYDSSAPEGSRYYNQMNDVEFFIKEIGDSSYSLKPTTSDSGESYAWLAKQGGVAATDFADLGYYFKVKKADGKEYIAKQYESGTKTMVDYKYKDSHGNEQTVMVGGVPAQIEQVTIKVAFTEVAETKPFEPSSPVGGLGIVPFTVSKIGYGINLTNYDSVSEPLIEGKHRIKDVNTTINLNELSLDPTQFELAGINFSTNSSLQVEKKDSTGAFVREPALETELKGNDASGNPYITVDNVAKTITIRYPDSMKTKDEYRVAIYLNTKLEESQRINTYISSYVSPVRLEKTIYAVTKATINQVIPLDDSGNFITYEYEVDNVATGEHEVQIPYNSPTNIY